MGKYDNAEMNDQTEVIRKLKDFIEGQGIILSGKYGCGKTYAIHALLHKLRRDRQKKHDDLMEGYKNKTVSWDDMNKSTFYSYEVEFIKANEMYRNIKNFDKQDGYVDSYKYAAMLVIDDLGAEYCPDSGFFQSIIDEIIDVRYELGRSTIISTNLSIVDFRNRYGGRITDRIKEWGWVYESKEDSLRGK